MVLFDTLSSLQAIYNLKNDYPNFVPILQLHMELTRNGKEVVFIWVPGNSGNSAADSAAKDSLVGNISGDLIPLSDLKCRANKSVLELWQSVWDEFPENKLHKIFPNLKECTVCPRTNKRGNCDTPIAH